MIKLENIYFDGKSYAKYLVECGEEFSQEKVDITNRFNFTPVDSISFQNYQPQTYCDITIGDYYIQAVNITHLYTDIKQQTRTVLYPGHHPTPNPGGLY